MTPAFASTRQAVGFALLLGILLLAPWLLRGNALPAREDVYRSMRDEDGPYPFLHRQIFLEKGDVDIAFIGSSHVWTGIDTRRVQEELSRRLGREAVVVTLGWPWSGFDALYFLSRDLLRQRKVRMLVFYDDTARDVDGMPSDEAHRLAPHWFRWSEDRAELAGLPLRARGALYYAAIVGVPRNLLRRLLPADPGPDRLSRPSYWERKYHAPPLDETAGALSARLGIDHDPRAYVDFTPDPGAQPAAAAIYSPATRAQFQFTGPATPPAGRHFVRRLARLAAARRTRLVLLNFPDVADMRSPAINERECWPEALDADLAMLGVPPAALFAGLTDQQVRDLYYDHGHFNRNGQDLYTKLVCPGLLDLYENASDH